MLRMFGCWVKTPGKCVINDVMRNEIFPKYLEADLVIWAYPLYCFSFPSGTKAVMDRLLPMNLPYIEPGGTGHPRRFDKEPFNLFISTCGFYDAGIYDGVDKMIEHVFSGKYDTLYRTQGELFGIGVESLVKEALANIRQCGREYAMDGKISEKTRAAAMKELVDPDQFTKMANVSWDSQIEANKNGGSKTGMVTPKMMAMTFSSNYNGASYTKDLEVQMNFTDCNEILTFTITKDALKFSSEPGKKPDLEITVAFEDWMKVSRNEVSGQELVMEGRMKIKGGMENMMLFGKVLSPPSSK